MKLRKNTRAAGLMLVLLFLFAALCAALPAEAFAAGAVESPPETFDFADDTDDHPGVGSEPDTGSETLTGEALYEATIDLSTTTTGGSGYTVDGTAPPYGDPDRPADTVDRGLNFDTNSNGKTYHIIQSGVRSHPPDPNAPKEGTSIFILISIPDGVDTTLVISEIDLDGIIKLEGTGKLTLLLDGKSFVRRHIDAPSGTELIIKSLNQDDAGDRLIFPSADDSANDGEPPAELNTEISDTTTLAVSKTVEGAMANKTTEFGFVVGIYDNAAAPLDGAEFAYEITDAGGAAVEAGILTTDSNGEWRFRLKHGETLHIDEISADGHVQIIEDHNEFYEASFIDSADPAATSVVGADTSLLAMTEDPRTVSFINERIPVPETAARHLDPIPVFTVLTAVAIASLIVWRVLRPRRV